MPPSLPPSPRDKHTHVKTLARGDDRVLSMLSLSGWGDALADNDFDQQEWAETLIRHVRDVDPKISLSALREFRQTMLDLAKINGLITTVSAESVDKDENRKVKKVMSQQRLVQSMADDRLRLEKTKDVEGPHVVNPIPVEDRTEEGPGYQEFDGPHATYRAE